MVILDISDPEVVHDDPHRTDGLVFTFEQYGGGHPLPDDPVTLTDGVTEGPGRVYCVNYARNLVYVEPAGD